MSGVFFRTFLATRSKARLVWLLTFDPSSIILDDAAHTDHEVRLWLTIMWATI